MSAHILDIASRVSKPGAVTSEKIMGEYLGDKLKQLLEEAKDRYTEEDDDFKQALTKVYVV